VELWLPLRSLASLVAILVWVEGGTVSQSARLFISLVVWSITATSCGASCVYISRCSTATIGYPFRGISVLQRSWRIAAPCLHRALRPSRTTVGIMGAALGLATAIFIIAALDARAPRSVQIAGGVMIRALLLLYPPAARDSITLTNCESITLAASAAAGLNGWEASEHRATVGHTPTVTLSVLASDAHSICWVRGGSHQASWSSCSHYACRSCDWAASHSVGALSSTNRCLGDHPLQSSLTRMCRRSVWVFSQVAAADGKDTK